MLKELVKIADALDAAGMKKEANGLDAIINKLAQSNELEKVAREFAKSLYASRVPFYRIFFDVNEDNVGGGNVMVRYKQADEVHPQYKEYRKDMSEQEIEKRLESLASRALLENIDTIKFEVKPTGNETFLVRFYWESFNE